MKNLLVSLTVLILVLLSGASLWWYNMQSEQQGSLDPSLEIISNTFEAREYQHTYRIEEKKEEAVASCFNYRITNNGAEVENIPLDVQDHLSCPSVLPYMSEAAPSLYYADEAYQWVKVWDIEQGTVKELYELPGQLDGISFHGVSPDGQSLLIFVMSFQNEELSALSRIIVLTLMDGEVLESQHYDKRVAYACGSANCSASWEDLFFISNDEVGYATWEEDPYTITSREILRINVPN